MAVTVRVEGIEALRAKLNPVRLLAAPARKWADRSGQAMRDSARERAPKWRDGLSDSITYEVEGGAIPRRIVVFTNAVHGPIHEFGHAPYWPPPRALDSWAAAHGFGENGGFLVARSISRKGITGKHYMRDGTNASKPRLIGYAVQFGRDIEAGAAI